MAQEGWAGEARCRGLCRTPSADREAGGGGMGTVEGDSRLLGPASGRPSAHVLWTECCRALTHCPVAAWQGVERDLRSQLSGGERGLVEEYVEKVPNPSLKSEWGGPWGAALLPSQGTSVGAVETGWGSVPGTNQTVP